MQIVENPPVLGDEGSGSAAVVVRAGEFDTPEGRVNERQNAFIDAFIENGGKAEAAAIDAGYTGGAANMAVRNLAKPKIQAEIMRRLKLRHGSALAIAVGNLLEIIEESEDDRARVQAALGIMDRFGMAVPRGPAVQINTQIVNGQQANGIIAEVIKRRELRLSSPAPTPALPDDGMFDA